MASEHRKARQPGYLLCRLGLHPYPRSQGAVGYCTRGCGDLKRTDHGARGGWVRYVEPPRQSTRPAGLPPKPATKPKDGKP